MTKSIGGAVKGGICVYVPGAVATGIGIAGTATLENYLYSTISGDSSPEALSRAFINGGLHLEGTGLNIDKVNQALAKEVSNVHPGTGQFYKGQTIVDGVTIEYTSYGVKDSLINIGTYYPI